MTNLGAGILAATAASWYPTVCDAANAMTRTERAFEPDDAHHKVYDRLYNEVYYGLFPAIKQSVDRRLSELTYGAEPNGAQRSR